MDAVYLCMSNYTITPHSQFRPMPLHADDHTPASATAEHDYIAMYNQGSLNQGSPHSALCMTSATMGNNLHETIQICSPSSVQHDQVLMNTAPHNPMLQPRTHQFPA
mmetsp:Transcript_34022/g.75423  ORF Transcript_34022/g.75423 Transcript_34022/m.75423 type:complete len:107 (+) Transcript_34022:82-402(+)